jgi:hypothetical protein
MLALVGELMRLPPSHPAVQRGVMFTILPCIAMMVAPRQISGRAAAGRRSATRAALADDFVDFTLPGSMRWQRNIARHSVAPATRAPRSALTRR